VGEQDRDAGPGAHHTGRPRAESCGSDGAARGDRGKKTRPSTIPTGTGTVTRGRFTS